MNFSRLMLFSLRLLFTYKPFYVYVPVEREAWHIPPYKIRILGIAHRTSGEFALRTVDVHIDPDSENGSKWTRVASGIGITFGEREYILPVVSRPRAAFSFQPTK